MRRQIKPIERKRTLKTKIILTGLGLFTAANVGMAVKYHYDFDTPNTPAGWLLDIKGIPAEWEYTIRGLFEKKAFSEELKQPVSSIFDNEADKQLIEEGVNIFPESQENTLALIEDNPIPKLTGKELPTISMLFPFKLTSGGTALIETNYADQGFNPITGKSERINIGKSVTFEKAGSEIIVTAENAELFQIDPMVINDKEYFAGFILRFKDPDGIPYMMPIQEPNDIRNIAPIDSLKNAPRIGKDGFVGTVKDWKGEVDPISRTE